jgi:hypothetical protein
VGGGNTVFTGAGKRKATIERQIGGLFPLQNIGVVWCFGLPEEDSAGGK